MIPLTTPQRILKIHVDTGFVGAQHEDEVELPDDWDSLTEKEQELFKMECCQETINNFIDAWTEIVDAE